MIKTYGFAFVAALAMLFLPGQAMASCQYTACDSYGYYDGGTNEVFGYSWEMDYEYWWYMRVHAMLSPPVEGHTPSQGDNWSSWELFEAEADTYDVPSDAGSYVLWADNYRSDEPATWYYFEGTTAADIIATWEVTSTNLNGQTWHSGGPYSAIFFGRLLKGLEPEVSGCDGQYSIDPSGWTWDGYSGQLSANITVNAAAACQLDVGLDWVEGFVALEPAPPPPTVTVLLNGSDVTGQTQEVVVGQRISLSASVNGGSISTASWSVPGTTTGGWNADESSASEAATHFDQNPTNFYWVDVGSARTVTVNLELTDNSHLSASTTFNVVGPSGYMLATAKPETAITADASCTDLTGIWAHYGCMDPYSSSAVMFSNFYSPPSGFSGSFQWVQKASPQSISRTTSTGTVQSASCTGLDTSYPYSTASSTSDSPATFLPITYRDVQRSDSFTMTLMFQPSSASAIYVPIASVAWSWSVHATSSDSGETWTLAARTAAGTLQPGASTVFPTWTSNIANCQLQ